MHKTKSRIVFSPTTILNSYNIAAIPSEPSLYMISKKDKTGNNQVIFAGVASNLKDELEGHLNNNSSDDDLYFCYIPTSAKNVLKNSKTPLYQRVA